MVSPTRILRKSYVSPYGPKYKVQPHLFGFTFKTATNLGLTLGAFGGVAGFFALYFFADVPRVSIDVMQKIPIIGERWVKVVPPSDNPF